MVGRDSFNTFVHVSFNSMLILSTSKVLKILKRKARMEVCPQGGQHESEGGRAEIRKAYARHLGRNFLFLNTKVGGVDCLL